MAEGDERMDNEWKEERERGWKKSAVSRGPGYWNMRIQGMIKED